MIASGSSRTMSCPNSGLSNLYGRVGTHLRSRVSPRLGYRSRPMGKSTESCRFAVHIGDLRDIRAHLVSVSRLFR